jgi:hypothetical protein
MNVYESTVPQLLRILGQVHLWLNKAQAYAEQKKFDVNVLLQARLAPDQFPFIRQVQVVTDNAKGLAGRLAGADIPKFEDDEKTIDELRARLDKTIAFLKTLERSQFEKAAELTITLPFMPGKGIKGADYLTAFALPNFYFHVMTAYSILRHNGVDLGKMDYIGPVEFFDV